MKRIILMMAVLAVSLAVASCEKISHCLTGPYAPADALVSWTDYNSVEALVKYFDGHDSTLYQHQGDTIKVRGYLSFLDRDGSNCSAAWYVASDTSSAPKATISVVMLDGYNYGFRQGCEYNMTVKISPLSIKNEPCRKYIFCVQPLIWNVQ